MRQSAPSETGKKPEKSKFYEIGKEGGPAKSSAEIVTAENLSTALAEVSLKAGKTIKRASILTGQLEEAFLSLIMVRKKEAAMASRIGCIICRLVTLKV